MFRKKKIVKMLVAAALITGALPVGVFAADTTEMPKEECKESRDDTVQLGCADITYFPQSGMTFQTFAVNENGTPIRPTLEIIGIEGIEADSDISLYADSVKTTTPSYVLNVVDRNGKDCARLNTAITASYSQVEGWAKVEGITAGLSDVQVAGLKPEAGMNGDTATVDITQNGAWVGRVNFHIYINRDIPMS